MLVIGRQGQLHPTAHRGGGLFPHLVMAVLVFELLLVHVAQIIVWALYIRALGIFQQKLQVPINRLLHREHIEQG